MAIERKKLGDILVDAGLLTKNDVQDILTKQKELNQNGEYHKFGEVLLKEGYINKKKLLEALSTQLNIELKQIDKSDIDLEVLSLLNKDYLEEKKIIPLYQEGNSLVVATNDPVNYDLKNDIEIKTKLDVKWVLASEQNIIDVLGQINSQNVQGDIREYAEELQEEIENTSLDNNEDEVRQIAEENKVVKMVDEIIEEAVIEGASDIHIEPMANRVRLRYRIDGILVEQDNFPKSIYAPLLSRIKITANLDISKKREPQDGRINFSTSNNKEVDLRISTNPTIDGEKVVIRILDKQAQSLKLDDLGFTQENKEKYKKLINKSHGMVLLTGPTGSGKTTTLYSGLKTLDNDEQNISTIEDPVEYELEGISQSQVNRAVDYDFNRALETLLRQDPDVLMVGEIRDLESCTMAVDGAETGHLVLSTLHTNTSPKAVTRLLNMGVEPFLIASALEGVVAQRLVRTICPACKTKVEVEEEYKDVLNQEYIWEGEGCMECNQTGYQGRTAIHEILIMDNDIEELIVNNASTNEIKEKLKSKGFETLKIDGIKKVKKGVTTLEEVFRVTNLS